MTAYDRECEIFLTVDRDAKRFVLRHSDDWKSELETPTNKRPIQIDYKVWLKCRIDSLS